MLESPRFVTDDAESTLPEGRFSRRRRAIVAVVALVAGLMSFGAVAPAYAATGSISGNVQQQTGVTTTAAAADVDVTVYTYQSQYSYWQQLYSQATTTDSSGNYTISGLDPATYRICFGASTNLVSECWDNAETVDVATDIPVASGANVTAKNAVLAVGGQITGAVTSDAGAPLESTHVDVYRYNATARYWQSYTPSNDYVLSDSQGDYTVQGLATGDYRICFDPSGNFTSECYDGIVNTSSFPLVGDDRLTTIHVDAGATVSGKNASLTPGASISGMVSGAGSPNVPISSAYVQLYRESGTGAAAYWNSAGYSSTDSSGQYSILGLTSGIYRLCFTNYSSPYADECYSGAADVSSGTSIVLAAGQDVTGKNAVLQLGATVTGTLTASGPTNVQYAQVDAYQGAGFGYQSKKSASSDANGSYTIQGLRAGSYRLCVTSNQSTSPAGLVAQCWNQKATVDEATPFSVTLGSSTTKNFTLTRGATITGSVTGTTAGSPVPITSFQATAYRLNTVTSHWDYVKNVSSNGNYSLSGLAPGSYKVCVSGVDGYAAQCFGGGTYPEDSASVAITLTAGAAASGKDVLLVPTGSISGVLTDPSNQAIPDSTVLAYVKDQSRQSYTQGELTQDPTTGAFTISDVPSGSYSVCFSAVDFVDQCWDKSDSLGATPVVVASGQQVTGISATLQPLPASNGSVAGHIRGGTSSSSVPLANATVDLYRARSDGSWDLSDVDETASASDGFYSINDLAPGSYRLCVVSTTAEAHQYVNQCANGANTFEGAASFTVAGGPVVQDLLLPPTGSISGRLTDSSGNGVTGSVYVYIRSDYSIVGYGDYSDWASVSYAPTDSSGNYTVTGVGTDSYRICASPDDYVSYVPTCFGGAQDIHAATSIAATAGGAVTGKNIILPTGTTVSGTVYSTTAAGTLPQPNIGVVLYSATDPAGPNAYSQSYATTDNDGTYTLKGVPAGSWILCFETANGSEFVQSFSTQCWNNSSTFAGATPITVGSSPVTGKNATLTVGGVVSGTVTNSAGTGLSQIAVTIERSLGGGNFEPATSGYTNIDGTYLVRGLASGSYRVSFDDLATGADLYIGEYWNDSATASGATLVTVSAGGTASGISPTLAAAPKVITSSTPVITGVSQTGSTVTAAAAWGPGVVNLAYQWYLDGVAKSGATGSTLVLGSADIGKNLTVTVTGTKYGYPTTSLTSAAVGPVAPTFQDVPTSASFYSDIQWMFDQSISTGYVESSGFRTYHPAAAVTRRAMAAFLYRAAGTPAFTAPSTPSFSDVPTTDPFYQQIEWMKATGITTGNADGTYAPNNPVSRQAMAAFLYRAAGSPAFTPPGSASFSDVAVGSTFYSPVEWMKATAITNGYSDGTYHPLDPVSRQAMSAFLHRADG